jgi:D-alanyl-D-alanine carboxypeptidase
LLDGKLVVIGRGDPLWGDEKTDAKLGRGVGWIFDDIFETLKQSDVNSVGDVVVDSTFFDDMRVHDSWPRDQINRPYACEVCGLNYNGNCVRITARNVEGQVRLETEPKTGYLNIVNKVKAISKGSSAIGS